MTSIADGAVIIQTSSESVPSTPSWFGEVALIAGYLRKHGVPAKISDRVRFARRRFGRYKVIDFLAVLFGYAISGERTLEALYQRQHPFAVPFMALFERDQLPTRSTLSPFLAALTGAPSQPCARFFSMIYSVARSSVTRTRNKPEVWWIARETPGRIASPKNCLCHWLTRHPLQETMARPAAPSLLFHLFLNHQNTMFVVTREAEVM